MVLYKIDDWLIERAFEPFATWFKRWTGRGSVWLTGFFGCVGYTLASIFFLCLPIRYVQDVLEFVIFETLSLYTLTRYIIVLVWHESLEQWRLAEAREGYVNRERIFGEKARHFSLVVSPLFLSVSVLSLAFLGDSTFLFLGGWHIFVMASLYFNACTSPPPCSPKLRSLWNKLLTRVADAIGPPSKAPSPAN